jgi:hypothetical protein
MITPSELCEVVGVLMYAVKKRASDCGACKMIDSIGEIDEV